jgi:hypothetical protein
VEGETEGAIEHETRALYSMARAHAVAGRDDCGDLRNSNMR